MTAENLMKIPSSSENGYCCLLLMMLIEIAGFIFHHHYKDVLESFHRHHQGSSRAREPPSSNYYVYVMLSEFPSEMGEAKEGEFILGDPPHTPFSMRLLFHSEMIHTSCMKNGHN